MTAHTFKTLLDELRRLNRRHVADGLAQEADTFIRCGYKLDELEVLARDGKPPQVVPRSIVVQVK